MDENRNMTQNNQQPYQQQPYQPQQPYQQPQPPYQQMPYQQQPYQPQMPYQQPYRQPEKKVKNVFLYIYMGVVMASIINAAVYANSILDSVGRMMKMVQGYQMEGPYFSGVSIFSIVLLMLLSISVIIFMVLDVVEVHGKGYPITGLILFGLFFSYGYFIWRAHVTGQKKTGPIIYTVVLAVVGIISMAVIMLGFMDYMRDVMYLMH